MFVMLLLVPLTPTFAFLSLAAIVVVAVISMFEVHTVRHYWHTKHRARRLQGVHLLKPQLLLLGVSNSVQALFFDFCAAIAMCPTRSAIVADS